MNRCPTSIFLQSIKQAFKGTGEIEDGTIELEDLIVIIASCIDHVSRLIAPLVFGTDMVGTDTGQSVLFPESAGDEAESGRDGWLSEGIDGDTKKDRCEPVARVASATPSSIAALQTRSTLQGQGMRRQCTKCKYTFANATNIFVYYKPYAQCHSRSLDTSR
jgi:hypothetical protein